MNPASLLDFAFDLINQGSATEAHARRAVSAVYYSVFHSIAEAGAALFHVDPVLRGRIARSYDHGALAIAAREWDSKQARGLAGNVPDPRLTELTSLFAGLRAARERADYDLTLQVSWEDADQQLNNGVRAIDLLQQIRTDPDTAAFLLAPLIQKRTRRG